LEEIERDSQEKGRELEDVVPLFERKMQEEKELTERLLSLL